MRYKKFWGFVAVSALLFLAALGGGGCGGSSGGGDGDGGNEGGGGGANPNPASPSAVFIGTSGGDLWEALQSKLAPTSFDAEEGMDPDVLDSLGSGDVAIFGLDYCKGMTGEKAELLKTLYDQHVTLALLEPDGEQVNALRGALELENDDSIPSKEAWNEYLTENGYTANEPHTGTVSLYALTQRKEGDGKDYGSANVLTYVIPNDAVFASGAGKASQGDVVSPDDSIPPEEIEQEFQAGLKEVWDEIWKECGFTEGTPGTGKDSDGSATVVYDGVNTITVTGPLNDGEEASFTLTRESNGAIALKLSDNLLEDIKEEIKDEAAANKAYQEDRVQNFLDWNEELDEIDAAMTADKAEIRAAADEVKLADLNGESRAWNCSPPAKWKTMKVEHKLAWYQRSIRVNRQQTIIINTYPIHNFTDGSDWFIVRLTGTLNPSGQYKREEQSGACDLVYGHTGYYTLGAYLDGGSASGLTLIDSSPKNVNRTQTKTVGLTLNLSGKIGVSDKGPSGEIGGGITRTNSTSYTVQDYETINDSGNQKAKVSYRFAHPTKGSKGNGIIGDGLEDAVWTSRATFNPDVQAVWKVDKSYWQRNGAPRKLTVTLDWADAIARGNLCVWYVTVASEAQVDYPETTAPYSCTVTPPMHMALGKKNIAASKKSQAYAFTLLSEENWKATMDEATASWCKLNATSGGPTSGENERTIMVEVGENTTGAIREGKITFSIQNGGRTENHILTVTQASTDTLNP